jgi:23S rRNA (adenine1618-N6)-methyltransferase
MTRVAKPSSAGRPKSNQPSKPAAAAKADPKPKSPARPKAKAQPRLKQKPKPKAGLHPRNRHAGRYDFPTLVKAEPELDRFLRPSPLGDPTVDFTNPLAVKALNRALLAAVYGIKGWDIPPGFLCPPIPGRADYLHHLADLLTPEGGEIPRGPGVRILDLGTGANLVYPLVGHAEYGWSFLGSDITKEILEAGERILAANKGIGRTIVLRLQPDAKHLLQGLLRPGERYDACMCNPPFYGSQYEARGGTERKWRNLGREEQGHAHNFGGQAGELWCPGGELAFIGRLITESQAFRTQVGWFTTLVAKAAHLGRLQHALRQIPGVEQRVLEMGQGQKQSRILAWRFTGD